MFEIRNNQHVYGPYTRQQIIIFASEGRLHWGMEIRQIPNGTWQSISNIEEIKHQLRGKSLVRATAISSVTEQPIINVEQPIINPAAASVVSSFDAMGRYYRSKKVSSASNSLGITGLILGFVALLFFWFPFLGLTLAACGLLLGIIGIILSSIRKGYGIGFGIGASVVCLCALVINWTVSMATVAVVEGIDQIVKEHQRNQEPEKYINEFDVEEWNELVLRKNKRIEMQRLFKVVSSSITSNNNEFFEKPVIKMTVFNGTKHPVRTAYFHAKLTTPGRSVPWVDADFNYDIPGGLEPGEIASWSLSPNFFDSDWDHALEAKDANLLIQVDNLDDLNGNYIYPTWDDSDQRKFERLKKLRIASGS